MGNKLARALTGDGPERRAHDFYPTEPAPVYALLDELKLPTGLTIW